MKNYEEIIGEAVRIEYEQTTGRLFIVFEIKSEKQKNFIKSNWANDIECRIIDRLLVTDSKE
jgi:hypothetical protein